MIKKVAVIGAGQMGGGIAQSFSQASYDVILYDVDAKALKASKQQIKKSLNRRVEKEEMSKEERTTLLQRINITGQLSDVTHVQLVIEAVPERLDLKCELFKKLDDMLPREAIFATNTSALPITKIASVTSRPEKVIGMHFMNPVPIMKLVEVIRALQTDDATYDKVVQVVHSLNKTAVQVGDFPGFVANRILMPMINEAVFSVYEGIATIEDVDKVMTLGMNHPMGPLRLADFIGLDTCLYIMKVLYEHFGDSKYRPCPLLQQYVQAGWYGQKTGRGFYRYD